MTTYYSQNDEERVILDYFGSKTGRCLDIGAFDGIRMSNSRRLIELGWSAVLVEPSAANLVSLIANCAGMDGRVVIVQAAVSTSRQLTRLWIDTDDDRKWSTTINRDLLASGSIRKPTPLQVMVPTIEIADLMKFGPFDFITIDAEWEDSGILGTAPEELISGCSLLCIESRDPAERMAQMGFLSRRGFTALHQTPENLIVARSK